MDAIINFFKSIGEVITSCISLVWTLLEDLVQIILMLANFLAQIPGLLSWLPPDIGVILFATITVVVIYKITGREG